MLILNMAKVTNNEVIALNVQIIPVSQMLSQMIQTVLFKTNIMAGFEHRRPAVQTFCLLEEPN